MKTYVIFALIFGLIQSSPLKLIQSIAENAQFPDIDNYLPKTIDLPKYEYPTYDKKDTEEIQFKRHDDREEISTPTTTRTTTVSSAPVQSTTINYIGRLIQSYANNTAKSSPEKNSAKLEHYQIQFENKVTPATVNRTSSMKFENQLEAQEEEEEDENGGNPITSLLSAFLGGLSRPDGSIDLDAITGLLGSLIMQNPDGTFNFMGLQDLISGLFGGGEGSDVGAFVGGLTGALLKGIANPPGAKGVGKITGKIVAGVLPALVAPPNGPDGEPQDGIDPFGFLFGFLKTFLSGSSAEFNSSSTDMTNQVGKKSKFSIIKAIVSTITSIFGASSSSSKPQDW